MNSRKKRWAAAILAVCLCVGALPVKADAAGMSTGTNDTGEAGAEHLHPEEDAAPEAAAGLFEAVDPQADEPPIESPTEPAGDGGAYEEPAYEEPVYVEPAPEEEKKEEVLHQPKLVLESHNLDARGLSAGEEKAFLAVFRNRSRDRSIYNLKLSVSFEDAGVTADQSSFYFERIGPQGQMEIDMLLRAAPQAEQKNVTMAFTMEYEDDKGTACTGAEELGFFLRQPAQAAVNGFHMADQVFASDRLKNEITVVNTGKAPIYQVQVTVEGKGLFVTEKVLLGSLEAGASGEGELGIYVGTRDMKEVGENTEGSDQEKYGSTEGTLLLTYRDALGEEHEQKQTFTTVIQKAKILELKVEEEKEETNQWWISVFVLALSAAACGLVILGAQLRKSRRRLREVMVIREEVYGEKDKGE